MYPDSYSALPVGTKIDQYVVSGVLGRGGFGITYIVRDTVLEKAFALKEFFPEGLVVRKGTDIRVESNNEFEWGLKRFYDEAKLLAQFNHPNITSVRRVFEANSTAYMLLDLIKGRTFERWLRGLDSPPIQQELDLVTFPLLNALELVHGRGVCHLDISPENIMIRAVDGAAILLDFGAARFDIKQYSQLVSATIFKSGFSAPEQYAPNAKHYGAWTDIYGLAATLYRAISGKRPVDAPARRIKDELVPAHHVALGNFREHFTSAIDWGLVLEPAQRPQTIGEWREALFEGTGRKSAQAEVILEPLTADPSPPLPSERLQFQVPEHGSDALEHKDESAGEAAQQEVKAAALEEPLKDGNSIETSLGVAEESVSAASFGRWAAIVGIALALGLATFIGLKQIASTEESRSRNTEDQAHQQAIIKLKEAHSFEVKEIRDSFSNTIQGIHKELATTKRRADAYEVKSRTLQTSLDGANKEFAAQAQKLRDALALVQQLERTVAALQEETKHLPPANKEQKSNGSQRFVAGLMSEGSQSEAQQALVDVQQRCKDALGLSKLSVKEVKRDGKVWYRIIVEPAGLREAAERMCSQLRGACYPDCTIYVE